MLNVTRKLHHWLCRGVGWAPLAGRSRQAGLVAIATAVIGHVLSVTAIAAQEAAAPGAEPMQRTIYVPFDDLPVLLSGPNERVFMTQEEYQHLQAEAAKKPPKQAPHAVVLLSAAYQTTIRENVATTRGQIELEVLEPGLHAVPLPLQGVMLRSAMLGEKTAAMALAADGQVVLFLREAGTHRLELELHSPVIVAAAQQSLQFRLPSAGSATLGVAVPGNVEVKSGASVVRHEYDEAADQTRFELVFSSEPISLVMSLNNRRLLQGRVVATRSVLVSELTTSYERLHITAHMNVLHGAVDRFEFDVPDGFQVTGVTSPLLSQWIIRQEADQSVLEVALREPVRGTETLNISASRAPVTLGKWTMPQFQPRDVAGQVAVVGLLAETRLRPLDLQTENLIHLDTSVLRDALPASIFEAEPGAPAIRQIAAYYAPGGNFSLTAALEDPRDELRVATHLLLSLDEDQQTLRGGFTLTPQATKLTAFAFQLPADWQLEQLHGPDQKPLALDRYHAEQDARYVVQLPATIEPGMSQTIFFVASHRSAAWLSEWSSTAVEFPRVRVEQATDSSGAIAVQANGDFVAKPEKVEGLTPLDSKDRSKFGLADSSNELTYQLTGDDYHARILVERRQPRISTRNYSFFQVKEGVLVAHCEVVFIIERAHAKSLQLELPDSTPTSLSIRGLDNVQLKEYSHVTRDGKNLWTVLLAKAESGAVRLAIDFEQRLPDPEPRNLVLPVVRATGVAYQTQMVAIEGDPALDIDIQTDMRRVDVGELVEAQYAPGRRLLGCYASTAESEDVLIHVTRRALRPLPAAIIKRAELVTVVSSSGLSQSSARYLLQTKVPFLAIGLPQGTQLWSVTLNGKPIKPRRRGDQVLLSLQTASPDENRDLQVVYETPVGSLNWIGSVRTHAPQLWLALDELDQGAPVPQVDLIWYVHLPTGYSASRVRGTVFSNDVQRPRSPLDSLAQAAVVAGGGVHRPPMMPMQAARERFDVASASSPAARAGTREMYLADDVGYGLPSGQMSQPPSSGPEVHVVDGSASMRFGSGRGGNDSDFAAGQAGRYRRDSGQRQGESPAMDQSGGGQSYGPGMGMGVSGEGMGGMPGMGGMGGGGSGDPFGAAAGEPAPEAAAPHGGMDSGTIVMRDPLNRPTAQTARTTPEQLVVPPTPGKPAADPMIGKYWALQGLRGLEIRLDQSGEKLAFQSLGTDPLLDITVFQQSRMNWFAAAVALSILVVGLFLSRATLRRRVRFVVAVAVVAWGLPLVGGPATEFAEVGQQALLAALALIPIWVLIAVVSRSARWIAYQRRASNPFVASAVAIVAISLLGLPSPLQAQDIRELLGPLLEENKPVVIPDDAVVIPYDPSEVAQRGNATKVLVPYNRYVELWNLAHPDQQIGPTATEPKFSFAGARYDATLGDQDQMLLEGTVDIELFTDESVEVPLALQDGVITKALLDGKPARLKANIIPPEPEPPAPQGADQQQAAVPVVTPERSVLTLLVEGRGRHQLELAVRVPVARQGGWRSVGAAIPYAAATEVRLNVPTAGTSVRRPLGETMLTETTGTDAQTLETTLQSLGRFEVTWRGQITPGTVDQALTASSAALVDVREDGVRVAWRVNLTFGQTERGTFRLEIPADYLVEKVDGKNVRGWDTQQADEKVSLTIELLKAVKQNEELTIHLSRRTAIASATQHALTAPFVSVPDAALHRGVVRIRRSPILELQTTETAGVSRTDGGAIDQQLAPQESESQSPLGVRDYQAYEFNATPFKVAMIASQIAPHVTAQLRTIFRIGETESALESEIVISTQQRAIYSLEVAIPAELKLEQVTASGLTDWARVSQNDRTVLRAFFSAGQVGSFPLSIRGKLSDHAADQAIDLPRIEVLDVDQQRGAIAVQVDPSLDARAIDLQQCRNVLLDRVAAWLNEEQRPLARLALEYQNEQYAGKIQVTPREPRVVCNTVTNVRVTYREIQETILLDFHIMEAGIRQVTFQLPARLRDANISALRLRQKSITPVAGEDYVRVQLDLQDAITGDYRVVIEHDRAISPGRQTAPLPLIDLGTVNSRYVTLENAGRDEIVLDGTPGMEAVVRPSRQWEQLAARLQGGDFTTAFVATDGGAAAQFGYQTKQRAMVSTAGATIGLARTELVLDASGAYRASMLLKVDNRTEPYLEIRLPDNSRLWTAHVASRPVKPARGVGSLDDSVLRIPLIKTAEGDLDYPVVLKYAGKFDRLGMLAPVRFPIIRTENIHIELSQVKLFLPEDHHWYQFDGTATRVRGEEDFVAGYVAYQTQQVEKLTQIIRASNEFSKSRAVYNVGRLGKELQQLQSDNGRGVSNEQLRVNLYSNARVLEAATQEIEELEKQDVQVTDNRERLNTFFEQQQNGLSRNSVTRLGGNFSTDARVATPAEPTAQAADVKDNFDTHWFERQSQLSPADEAGKPADEGKGLSAAPSKKRLQQEESYRVQQQIQMPEEGDAAKQVFQAQPRPEESEMSGQSGPRSNTRGLGTKAELNRAYMDKIQQLAPQDSESEERQGQQQATQQEATLAAGALDSDLMDLTTSTIAPQQGLAGLASLDFELPQRGRKFYFTTPRGDVTITARSLRADQGQRLVNLLWLLALVVAFLLVAAIVRRAARSRTGRIVSVILLCIIGLIMLVTFTLPLFGLALFFGAILLAIDGWRYSGPRNGPASVGAENPPSSV